MFNKEYPIVRIIRGENRKWRWSVGSRDLDEQVFVSTASFTNAEIVLNCRNIPYVMVD